MSAEVFGGLDPEEELALAYAPKSARARLTPLLMLDRRLASVVDSATEPMLAQIRLAWWREQLGFLGSGKTAPAEPLLQMFGDNSALIEAAQTLVDAWEEILADPTVNTPDEARAAALLGDAPTLGAKNGVFGWALASRGEFEAARKPLKIGLANKWPRAFRAQRILARRALADMDGGGKPLGHPSRVARIAWWGLTGR